MDALCAGGGGLMRERGECVAGKRSCFEDRMSCGGQMEVSVGITLVALR